MPDGQMPDTVEGWNRFWGLACGHAIINGKPLKAVQPAKQAAPTARPLPKTALSPKPQPGVRLP